jgi:restriction system protein
LLGQRARKGIFITTSDFSKDALQYVNNIDSKIILIDGRQLAELMIEHNVGVSPVASYEIKKIDSDYFMEE